MILRWVARLWLWLTEERPPKHPPNPYPKGDPPSTSPPPLRLVKNWGDAVNRTRDELRQRRDAPRGLDWDDDD